MIERYQFSSRRQGTNAMLRNFVAGLSIGAMLCTAALAADTSSAPGSQVTFSKDVLPILQKNCQECHRPGEIAPMSLLSYQDARPWAKSIKAAVKSEKMPPWFMDAKYEGHFTNSRKLSPAEIETLVAWADGGAVEGDAKDKPAPRSFESGWNLKPDM